jgi:hypothetical protein
MTAEDLESQTAKGQRVQSALRLGPGAGPSRLVLSNPEWVEADRLGRALLDHLDAQDQSRRTAPAEPNGDE